MNTQQQKDLSDKVVSELKIPVDYKLGVMSEGQTLSFLTATLHEKIRQPIEFEKPDYVIVQGDTATAFVGALEGYYHGAKIIHVEAGLRTKDIQSPFPEEAYRQMISRLASIHFCPTVKAEENLNKEGIFENVYTVGNTGIDTLLSVANKVKTGFGYGSKILVTLHRRESFGDPMVRVLDSLKEIAMINEDTVITIPVHPNPNVKELVYSMLSNIPNIKLIEPLEYKEMVKEMKQSDIIITDSGGIQEEAPSLEKPVLVVREKTERQEGVDAGVLKLVGTDPEKIISAVELLLTDSDEYERMIGPNPFGDGTASEKIVDILKSLCV